jgi:hypothetical protein
MSGGKVIAQAPLHPNGNVALNMSCSLWESFSQATWTFNRASQ